MFLCVGQVRLFTLCGYLSNTVEEGLTLTLAPTFTRCDKAGLTMKDLSLPEDADENFIVIMWGSEGNPLMVQEDAWITEHYPDFAEEHAEDNVWLCYDPDTQKWFHFWDYVDSKEFDMSDYPIAPGMGFSAISGDGDKALTSAGEVSKDAQPVTVEEGLTIMTGNIAPKDMTIGDFFFDEKEYVDENFIVIIWGKEGNPLTVEEDEWITEKYPDFAAGHAEDNVWLCFDPDSKKWFHFWDYVEDKAFDMTAYPIKAGQGFSVISGDGDKTIYLPSAL